MSIDGNTELSRQERYKIYGDIQPHLVQRMPNISTPFLALKLPVSYFLFQKLISRTLATEDTSLTLMRKNQHFILNNELARLNCERSELRVCPCFFNTLRYLNPRLLL